MRNDVANFIWERGTHILLGIVIVYIILCIFYRKYAQKLKQSILKKILRLTASVIPWLIGTIIVMQTIHLIASVFEGKASDYDQKIKYIKTALASQTDIEVLFEEKSLEIINAEVEVVEYKEQLEKLHVNTDYQNDEITEEKLNYYYEQISMLYKGGERQREHATLGDMELRKEAEEAKALSREDYEKEAEIWHGLYDESKLPSDVYQSSRALRDALEVACDMQWTEGVVIAAEAINRGEIFLSYEDRTITCDDEERVFEAGDICFYNGKSYYQLAQIATKSEEGKRWENDLWMLSYACMCYVGADVSEEDENYAIINYYIGNLAQRLLNKVPVESDIYVVLAKKAEEHYDKAIGALTKDDEYYIQEKGMKKNIENGRESLPST